MVSPIWLVFYAYIQESALRGTPKTITLIPKPLGQAGKLADGGYQLVIEMGLENDTPRYDRLLVSIPAQILTTNLLNYMQGKVCDAANKHFKPGLTYSKQNPTLREKLITKVSCCSICAHSA